jgi:glyoxylase-like metal-dependent hydrolase (beta-lactamase superfamily II)
VKVEWITVGPFQENSYLVYDETTRHAVLVDPGDEPGRILAMVRAAGVAVEAIWLTHGHLDHVGAVAAVKREWPVPVLLHPADLTLHRRAGQQAAFYGVPFEQPPDPDGDLGDGDVLQIGSARYTVRHTPGHSPGHVMFVGDTHILGGDLLFAGSVGRTDLPLSNPDDMESSLALLATLEPDLVVYPGHGPPTRIATELATNPFLAGVRTSL